MWIAERETKTAGFPVDSTVADPDLELGEGGEDFVVLLALPDFLPSVMSSFLLQIRAGECPPLDPPVLSHY